MGAIFGARNGNYRANGYSFFIRFSNATKPVFCRTGAETQGSDFALDEIVTLTCEGLSAEWVGEESGVSGSITSTGTNDDGVNPMVIFNLNTGAKDAVKPDIAYVPMKLYSFQIYEADQLVRDFVPCYRKADGAIGLYDCVLGTFFANAGSGAFLKGDDVFDLGQLDVSGSPDRFGEVTPAYGATNGLVAGESFVCSAPACGTNDEFGVAACVGYVVYTNGSEYVSGLERSFTYTHPDCAGGAVLVWQWEPTHYKLDVDVVGGGTVDVESQFVTSGSVITATATPNAGMKFWKWTGTGATEADRYRTSMAVTLTEAKTLTANFYDPATTPRIVRYVTPSGAGTKDGTSWENAMNSVATAYASVGANPGGGEVWLAKGRHTLNSAIAIVPHVNVRGGFAGTETKADEADPKTNPTILSHSNYKTGTDTWPLGGEPMWTGDDLMTFVDPPDVADDDIRITANCSIGGGAAFECMSGGLIEDCEICGVDFFKYTPHAIKVTAQNVSPLVIRNCRFLMCGWTVHNGDKVVNVSDAPLEIYDCQFRACQNPVAVMTASTDSSVTTNVCERCLFYACDNNWTSKDPGSAGILAFNNAKLTVRGSSFEKCRLINTASSSCAGAILLRTTQDSLIEDTVIRRSVTANQGTRAAGLVYSGLSDFSPRIELNRCRFEKCRYSGVGCGAHNSVGAAIGCSGTGSLWVNDTAFIGNIVTNCSCGDGSISTASCISLTGTWYGSFANCTFEDNVSVDTTGKTIRYTFATAWTATRYFAFANCVFNNNTCGYSNTDVPFTRQAEFYKPNLAGDGQTYSFVNCVFANEAADYIPFVNDDSLSWKDDLAFANCVSSSKCGWGTASTVTFRYQPLDNETLAPLKDYTETNGVTVARGIAETSAYRKKGRPVYRAANGDLYIYDTVYTPDAKTVKPGEKPWRLLRSPGTVYTPEEGAEKGLSLAMPIADAFGEARSKIKGALGPIDWPHPGMMLLVK